MNALGAVMPAALFLLAAFTLASWSVHNTAATLKDGKIDRTALQRDERMLR